MRIIKIQLILAVFTQEGEQIVLKDVLSSVKTGRRKCWTYKPSDFVRLLRRFCWSKINSRKSDSNSNLTKSLTQLEDAILGFSSVALCACHDSKTTEKC